MSDDRDRTPIPSVRRAIEVPPSKRRVHRSVQEELQFHLEERIEELVAAGMSRDAAEAEARKRFGNVQAIGSELETIDLATYRRRSLIESLHAVWDDARHAVRGLVRQPGFALTVILTLALGIGATTVIFSAVEAVLLRPLPTPWLDRLAVVRYNAGSLNLSNAALSPSRTLDLIERTQVFEAGTGYYAADFNLTMGAEARRVSGALTIGDLFGTFGMRPHLGRFYGPSESDAGSPSVVVLSHGMWQAFFGGEESALGRTLQLDDRAYEIIGVAPPGAWHPRGAQFWTPQELTASFVRRQPWLMTAVYRVRAEVDDARLEQALASQNAEWIGDTGGERSVVDAPFAVSFVEFTAGELRPILLVLMAAVLFVLLIACANIASLQLVRATGRAREVAVRVALGSGKWPILRQRLVESAVLAVAGGALGLLLGAVAIAVMSRLDVGRLEALRDVQLDGTVLLFAAAAVILSGLVFGVAPAFRAARVDPQEALKESPRGASAGAGRQRFLQAAVVVQVALASVLLLGAGLAIRSLAELLEIDPGFRPDQVLTMQVSLTAGRYQTPAMRAEFRRELVERLRRAPGVQSAGLATTSGLPFSGLYNSNPIAIIGAEPLPDGEQRHANLWFAGGDYFQAMGIPLVAGRYPDDRDTDRTETVFVIDEQLAEQYFPGEDPIGRRIVQGPEGIIIGVVGSVKKSDLGEPPKASVYHWIPQHPWIGGALSVVVRGSGDHESLVNTTRTIIREIDPGLPIYDIQRMSARVDQSLAPRRFAMRLLGGFALLALLLASLGIYGVISYATSQRTQEIGIRVALGAKPGDITRMVLRAGGTLALVGLLGGALIFIGVERMLGSLLYGLDARDPITIVGSVLVLGSVALLACWIPARRAARVDPTVALKSQ